MLAYAPLLRGVFSVFLSTDTRFEDQTMYVVAIIFHLVLSIVLCVVVLLQNSKGDGLAGAFGGGGAGQAVFGARGVTTILHKATIYLGAAFMVSSVILVFLTMHEGAPTATKALSRQAAERVPVHSGPATQGDVVPLSPEQIPADENSAPQQPAGDTRQSGSDAQENSGSTSQGQGSESGGGGQ